MRKVHSDHITIGELINQAFYGPNHTTRDEAEYISAVYSLNLSFFMGELEEVLDSLSEKLVGTVLLGEVNYKVVGLGKGENELLVEISGDITVANPHFENEDLVGQKGIRVRTKGGDIGYTTGGTRGTLRNKKIGVRWLDGKVTWMWVDAIRFNQNSMEWNSDTRHGEL